ncbi:MAG TPA: cupin domain-containing protein [Terriglobales bacterium]|nr:cupin domain-containing protein [Terriglobales bacterium]
MAVVRIPDENRTLREMADITAHLASIGIDYERWEPNVPLEPGAEPERILASYEEQIAKVKRRGGYVTADVIDVSPGTPNLEAMLAKFSREHWHDEDEVRFILDGRGLFHIHPRSGPLTTIEVEAGDLIRVPRGTWHWFDLCGERRIRAIRLFQDAAGWTPRYTDSGLDRNYQPVCMGSAYFPPHSSTARS